MFDNEILSPNEKVKKIRQLLRITQEELADIICTRSNLSLIENGRQKLTFNLASGLANNFNKVINEKGLGIKLITAEFLMKDEDEQANEIFTNITNELEENKSKEVFEKKFTRAEKLVEEYNISDNKKIRLYKIAADLYYNQYHYSKSDEMCSAGLKICLDSKNVKNEINFYIYKARNSIKTMHYNDSLKQLEYAEKLNKQIENQSFFEDTLYFKGLTYKKLGEYDEALKCLKILKDKSTENINLLLKVKMVYANCLNEQHKFEDAEKEYIETLDIAIQVDDKDLMALTYKNLSELYYNEKKYKAAAKYITDALNYVPRNEYLNEILFFAAKVFKTLNEDVEHYLLRSLEICEEKDKENLNLIEDILYELVLIYTERHEEEKLILITQKAKELNKECYLIYLKLIEYYMSVNVEKGFKLIKESSDKVKQIKEK